jgi:uncharacterized 2Fe-2S/4Fe-4S cluster protein (DUF4445 family)
MPHIFFQPDNSSISVPEGTTILGASRLAGVLIDAPCNGAGHCGKCAVRVAPKDLHKLFIHAHHHLSVEQEEAGIVLACHVELHGDLTVYIPQREEHDLQIITGGVSHTIERSPFISKRFEPADSETIVLADGLLLNREPGDTSAEMYGVVVDIGTTTLAVGLIDLATGVEIVSQSALNPQTSYGQDVLSRIKFASEEGGLKTLRSAIIRELNRLIAYAATEAGIRLDNIYEVIFSGNSCMLHLATGVDPAPLGRLPFTPAIRGGNHLPATSCGLDIAMSGLVWLPPIISAYVGADITAGILAGELHKLAGVTLFIDIGTNGEMVLANNGALAATATAAGPAFEGMNISCGMRAAAGAIEEVAISPVGDLSIKAIGNCTATGICGSGLMDLTAELVRFGVIAKSGRFADPATTTLPSPLAERLHKDGGKIVFRLTGQLSFTQNDVRQVQLAKGAIRAGIDLLLQSQGISPIEIDRVFIAGSFGYHLREESLLTLGLLPPEVSGKISFLGNTAKSGAEMLLLNHHLRQELLNLVDTVEVVELAANPSFDRSFMEAMKF